jgi:hypothetical protein
MTLESFRGLQFFNSFGAGGFNPCIETDFSKALEQMGLTPAFTNQDILLKGAKNDDIFIHAKYCK